MRKEIVEAASNRKVNVRFITEITRENISSCREVAKFAALRHIDNLKGNFAVTDNEYYAFASLKGTSVPSQAIYSRARAIVEQQQYVFDSLWEKAIPAEEKILELESGITKPKIEVISSVPEITRMFRELVESARDEIMLVFPTVEAFHREESLGMINRLVDAAHRGVKVRVLTPVDEQIEETVRIIEQGKRDVRASGSIPTIEFRAISRPGLPHTVTMVVVGNDKSLIIEQKDNSKPEFEEAIGLAMFSTSMPYVRSQYAFFETLWVENELRRREAEARKQEERAHRQAELLQDIVTHDLRNHLQVAKLGLDLLSKQEPKSGGASPELLNYVQSAIDDSSELIERTKKLGKILGQKNPRLGPVALLPTIERSLDLVARAYPQKSIKATRNYERDSLTLPDGSSVRVMADELLGEAFVNVFSNSAKYTDGPLVPLKIEVEETTAVNGTLDADENSHRKYWKVRIADWGRGIPEEVRPHLFDRYLANAKGSGLGMSIIHALISERYRGLLTVSDRVENDYSGGTVLEMYIPKTT